VLSVEDIAVFVEMPLDIERDTDGEFDVETVVSTESKYVAVLVSVTGYLWFSHNNMIMNIIIIINTLTTGCAEL
jgi:phosphoribosylpyrophosphate synthetase